MTEIGLSRKTLRKSSRFRDLPPFPRAWFLAACLLLRPFSQPLRALAWTMAPRKLGGDHVTA